MRFGVRGGRGEARTLLGLSLALERDGELEVVGELCDRVGALHCQDVHVRHACTCTVWRCWLIHGRNTRGGPAHSLLAPPIHELKQPVFPRSRLECAAPVSSSWQTAISVAVKSRFYPCRLPAAHSRRDRSTNEKTARKKQKSASVPKVYKMAQGDGGAISVDFWTLKIFTCFSWLEGLG